MVTGTVALGSLIGETPKKRKFTLRLEGNFMAMRGGKKKKKRGGTRGGSRRR